MSLTRDFLKGLELSDEQIGKVIAEHGKSVQELKEQIEKQSDSINNLNVELTEAQAKANKADELAETNKGLQESLDEANDNLSKERLDRKVVDALREAGGDDIDYLKFKLGEVSDDEVDDKIQALTESLPNHFKNSATEEAHEKPEEENAGGYRTVDSKLHPGSEAKEVTKDDILSIKDPAARQQAIMEHQDLF